MLFFNRRKFIVKLFNEWALEKGVFISNFNFLSFLVAEGLINEESAIKYCHDKALAQWIEINKM